MALNGERQMNIDWDHLSVEGWVAFNARPFDFKQQLFLRGGVGLSKSHQFRTDDIQWIGADGPAEVLEFLNHLQQEIRKELRLPVQEWESHWATYEKTGHYGPHIDQLKGRHDRLISLVGYFNKDWSEADGGQLVLHARSSKKIIQPEDGTWVMFDANHMVHEVLPTCRRRHSLVCWFKR